MCALTLRFTYNETNWGPPLESNTVLVVRVSLNDAHAIIICQLFQHLPVGSGGFICFVLKLYNAIFKIVYDPWSPGITELHLS